MTDDVATNDDDRRRFRRVNLQAELRLLAPEQHVMLLSHTVDLSRTGAFIRSNKALPVGTDVRLTIDCGAQREPLNLEAEVVRVDKLKFGRYPGIALRFKDLKEAQQEAIGELIETCP